MKKANLFKTVPVPQAKLNMFDLSHEVKQTGKFGLLYPCLVCEMMPGDVATDQLTVFLRAAPMLAPMMHLCTVTTHSFYVPIRLLTTLYDRFFTGGRLGEDAPVMPYVTPFGIADAAGVTSDMQQGRLWDYLGLPPVPPALLPADLTTEQISVLPFRAYAKIWNDWYRDPNFDTEISLDEDGEGDRSVQSTVLLSLKARGWDKDYFTSCLADAQRGDEVMMPLAGLATQVVDIAGDPVDPGQYLGVLPGQPGRIAHGDAFFPGTNTGSASVVFDSSGVSINDFRLSMAIQRWMEISARSGARYIETIEGQYGVRVPDYRLQRSEYLGGGKQQLDISEVRATAAGESPTAESYIGELAGHGVSVGKSNRFHYRCEEHGYVITLISVMPKPAYSQGIPRFWSRRTRYDFAWPALANLGEQAVINKELFFSFAAADNADNQGTFGYIPRYSEYKFMNDRIAGDFRTSLDFWHLSRIFLDRPVLDAIFTTMYENIGSEETSRRVFAVQDGTDYFWIQMFHHFRVKRPLSYFGVPSIR